MLTILLPIKESSLKSDIVSRLIPITINEKARLLETEDSPEKKMRFVETLWLFGNLLDCED